MSTKTKDELKNKIRLFRDKFKKYDEVCGKIWEDINNYIDTNPETLIEEKNIRESLTEEWGELEPIFIKLGAPRLSMVPNIGIRILFFDEALSARFDNPNKGEGIQDAISSATKAMGLTESLSSLEYQKLNRRTPNLFISYAFRQENADLITKIKEVLSSFPISVVTGTKPGTGSISEKVKGLIMDSDFVLAILTKDGEGADGSKVPSKWVFDEIAFALGQGKPIIRLLESGASYKSAISGDAEYISFDRQNLTESIIKLVQTINSLLS